MEKKVEVSIAAFNYRYLPFALAQLSLFCRTFVAQRKCISLHLLWNSGHHHTLRAVDHAMEYFSPCPVTNTGTFVPLEGEFMLTAIDKATILTHDKKPTPYTTGLLSITTHRIIWTDASRSRAAASWLAHLSADRPVEDKSSPFHPRAHMKFGSLGLRVEFGASSAAKDRDRFITHVVNGVRRKEWEAIARSKAAQAAKKAEMAQYVPRRIGISGVAERVEQRSTQQRQTIDSGFESLEQLRAQAVDLVNIATAFKSATRQQGDNNENELVNMMAEMGIESPVTKSSTGGHVKIYREQLSRQLAQFLQGPIIQVGGIMTMTDAYCLVMRNRATTELVSPEDFRAACDFFARLGLNIRTTTLESGVAALEVDTTRDDSGARALAKLAEERSSVTAIDVMRVRHMPVQRARVMLEEAEKLGMLVRDETTDGVRFFPNMFASFTTRAATTVEACV